MTSEDLILEIAKRTGTDPAELRKRELSNNYPAEVLHKYLLNKLAQCDTMDMVLGRYRSPLNFVDDKYFVDTLVAIQEFLGLSDLELMSVAGKYKKTLFKWRLGSAAPTLEEKSMFLFALRSNLRSKCPGLAIEAPNFVALLKSIPALELEIEELKTCMFEQRSQINELKAQLKAVT